MEANNQALFDILFNRMEKGRKKVLVLGGTGLVGEEIVKRLAQNHNKITIVSLGSLADKESFSNLKKQFPDIIYLTGNVFLPIKYKDKTFNELVESDLFLEEYLNLLYKKPNPEEFFIYEVINKIEPDIVIDAINSATVLSYTKSSQTIKDYLDGREVKLETLLATLSIPRLINFFDCLYKALVATPEVKTYLKIGTTGTGGMGFNIPYTHGENKPSPQLLEKAAISGAYTSLLYVLSKTFGIAHIKEVKPAALVGYKKVDLDRILLGRNSSQSLKVYKFENTQQIDLSEIKKLDFINLTPSPAKEDFKAVFVDTGENGQFSEEEFRTISNARQMGFVTKEEIADVVLQELEGKETKKEIITAFDQATMGPSKQGQKIRDEVLEKLNKLVIANKAPSLAFEILGPPRLAKLIFEAYLIKVRTDFKKEKLKKLTIGEKELDQQEILLIVSTGIPILLSSGSLIVGRKPKVPSTEKYITTDNINHWANEGWVDLREENFKKWQQRIKEFRKEVKQIEIGDLVAWIFEKEDQGFRY